MPGQPAPQSPAVGQIRYDVHGPVFDLATTIAKFVHLGLPLDDAIARATTFSARAMGIADAVGSLRSGMTGDVAAFALEESAFELFDADDVPRTARQRLVPKVVVKGGVVVRR